MTEQAAGKNNSDSPKIEDEEDFGEFDQAEVVIDEKASAPKISEADDPFADMVAQQEVSEAAPV